MALKDSLLAEFDHEMGTTRRLLERVPDARLAWKPHDRSMSLGGLATHLSNLPNWGTTILNDASYDLAAGPPHLTQGTSRDAILTFFDEQPHLFDLIQRAEVLRGPDFPWQEARAQLIRLVVRLSEEGRARGEFVIRDPELAALLLLGGLRSVIRFGKQPRPRELAQRIVEVFLRGNADGGTPWGAGAADLAVNLESV